jgi:hypothetical protein
MCLGLRIRVISKYPLYLAHWYPWLFANDSSSRAVSVIATVVIFVIIDATSRLLADWLNALIIFRLHRFL